MRRARKLVEPAHGLAPVFADHRAHARELLVPHVQRRQQRRVSGNLLEQRIALVERAHGALEGIKIGWPQLRKLHIHKTPSFRRAFLDDLQIFRRKQHAADMAQQFADAFRLPKPDAHGFFLLLGAAEDHGNLMRAVALSGFDRHPRGILSPLNQFFIARGSVAFAQAAQVQRL